MPKEYVATEPESNKLRRGMRFRDLYFAGITAVIGSGWLFGSYLTSGAAGPASILSWIIGGIFILIIALVWSEIATAVPIAGGAARYANFTHGGVAASIIAWSTILTYIAVPAVEAVAVVSVLQGAVSYYYPSSTIVLMNSSGIPSFLGVGIAVALSAVFFYVNYIGLRGLIKTNFGMTIWKLIIPPLAIALLLVVGLSHGLGSNFTHLTGGFMPYGIDPVFTAIPATGVVFAYLGFRQPVEMAAEAKSPGKDIWRALIAVTLTGIGMYTLLQIAFIGGIKWNSAAFGTAGVMPGDWAGLTSSVTMSSFPFFFEAVGLGMGLLGILLIIDGAVSPTGTLSQYMGSTARVLYGTAKEGYLTKNFFAVHTKYRVPAFRIIITLIVTIILLLLAGIGYLVSSVGGAWSALTSIVTTTGVFSYIIGPIALSTFRKAHPNLNRPFKLPAYGIIAPVAFIVSALMVYWGAGSLITSADPYGGYALLIIILAGILLYGYAKGRNFRDDLKSGAWVITFIVFNLVLLYFGEYGPVNRLAIPGYPTIPVDWFIEIIAAIIFYIWALKTSVKNYDVVKAVDRSIALTESAD